LSIVTIVPRSTTRPRPGAAEHAKRRHSNCQSPPTVIVVHGFLAVAVTLGDVLQLCAPGTAVSFSTCQSLSQFCHIKCDHLASVFRRF
jgi:hypothetical protein